MINYTLPEIRRLLVHLILRHAPEPDHVWTWSRWRRRRQHQARVSHYRTRGYPPSAVAVLGPMPFSYAAVISMVAVRGRGFLGGRVV